LSKQLKETSKLDIESCLQGNRLAGQDFLFNNQK